MKALFCTLLALTMSPTVFAAANLKLPSVFSDHGVLQSGEAKVYGNASMNTVVKVSYGKVSAKSRANAQGKWEVTLKGLVPSDVGTDLTVSTENPGSPEVFTAHDVIVGEVWIGSGQSNMQWTLQQAGALPEAKRPLDKGLRMFTVSHNPSANPVDNVKGAWVIASPETVMRFSAVAYYFGLTVREKIGQPVGLIVTCIGGTRAEAWGPRGMYAGVKEAKGWQEREDAAIAAKIAAKNPKNPAVWTNGPHQNWNGMVAPLVGYTAKGVIWYQGESNAENGTVNDYNWLMAGVITSWQKAWGKPLPFIMVQLPRYQKAGKAGSWPILRQHQQTIADKVPGAMISVNIDLGDATDIHPKDKLPVGQRLAAVALEKVYGMNVVGTAPRIVRTEFKKNEVILTFSREVTLENSGKGFELADKTKQWVPALAKVSGKTVTLSCESLTNPKNARYAWADFPEISVRSAGSDGLPAGPWILSNE